MEKVLVIGKGGREAALVHALLRSPSVAEVHACPGSAFMAQWATCHPGHECDGPALVALAQSLGITLTVVGPETSLEAGVVDAFQSAGLSIWGPSQAAARIESSKAFAKALMQAAHVPTASFTLHTDKATLQATLAQPDTRYPLVLKENGLRAGKGVLVAQSRTEALDWLSSLPVDEAHPIVQEDFLTGFECSLIVLAHGDAYLALPAAQDYKALYDGQKGPNTGGMGAVSPVPRLQASDYQAALDQVIAPTLQALKAQGCPFTGFLYAGLMVTPQGVKVIEFNARFGDPEAEVILPRLEGDLAACMRALLCGDQEAAHAALRIRPEACVGVVLSAPGYPGRPTDQPRLPDALCPTALRALGGEGLLAYHMGTKPQADLSFKADGGRVLILCALAPSLEAAKAKVYAQLDALPDLPFHYRHDIGEAALEP